MCIRDRRGSALLGCYSSENLRETLSVEDIIAKNQCYAVFPDKICADDKGIGQSSWLLLHLSLIHICRACSRAAALPETSASGTCKRNKAICKKPGIHRDVR